MMVTNCFNSIKYVFCLLGSLCFLSLSAQNYCDTTWFSGDGTQYGGVAGSNGGNCGIWVDEDDIYTCALNHAQYDSSKACGACIHAFGPLGDITVKVVDRCPECLPGDIDFSTGAFVKIATLEAGRVPIRWQFVPCALAEDKRNIMVFYDAGTSPYYFKAMFSNLYVGLQSVEFLNEDNKWVPIHREMYNYFVYPGGLAEDKSKVGPYTFRLTSWTGEQIVAENVAAEADSEFDLGVQFTQSYCEDALYVPSVVAESQSDNIYKVEVTDVQGRLLATLKEWNPQLLPKMRPQIVIVRQYAPNNVFVQKWVVR